MGIVYKSARARKDLGDIWFYIAEQSTHEQADQVLSRIETAAQLLASRPHMGRPRSKLWEGMRSWPVGSYIIFYFPLPDGIRILRVIHSRRDIPRQFD